MIDDDQEIDDLFLDDEAVEPLAGEIIMRGLSNDELYKVEKDLSALAKSLLETWNEKQPIPELDRFVNNIKELHFYFYVDNQGLPCCLHFIS